jgi:flagellar biosynthesis GTPase FlhF
MRICTFCKINKDVQEFGIRKTGALISECKKCVAIRSNNHYQKNKKEINEKRKKRYVENKEAELKKCKEYYANNRERIRKRANELNKLPERRKKANIRSKEWIKKNKQRHSENATRHRKNNPEKYDARQKVFWAVKLGFIKPKESCEICMKICKTQAHHIDYLRPLDVLWVCFACHREIHNKEIK